MGSERTGGGIAAGVTLGGYRIERLLGSGGMGRVFLAYDTTLRRTVAVKLIADSETGGSDPVASRARILREARAAAALNHPGICTIHEVGDAGGTAFIAMEYVEGRSIRERLEDGPLPVDDVRRYGTQAAEAVAYAHARGVVHGDLKAANILVTPDGRIKIVDFGLARRLEPSPGDETTTASLAVPATLGTPYAMAPEQVRGEPADARTDVWALGILLYEMTAGAAPFRGATIADLFTEILRDEPAPLPAGMPVALAGIITRCLTKDRDARYQTAGEVRAALTALDGSARTAPITRVSRRSVAVAAGVMLVLAIAAGGVAYWRTLAAPIRLAVLPFRNLTGDPGEDVFAAGLTEETIAQLGRLRSARLSVISGRASARYRGLDVPLDRIGRELGVDYVLEGTARREGTQVRLTAALIRARDAEQRWSDTFEHDTAGLLALERELAEGVARALSITLTPRPQAPVDPAAYEDYLKGLGHATRLTRADLDRALGYYQSAARRDPRFALAPLGIAQVWSARQQMQFARPGDAAPQIRAAVDAARRIDPELAEVHYRTASLYTWTDWNWAAAEPEFRRAIDLRPDAAEVRAFYAHYLLIMRRSSEATPQMERALTLDPLNDEIQSLCGVALSLQRRYGEAEPQFRAALQTAARSPLALNGLARVLFHLGRMDEALAAERAVWVAREDAEMVAAFDRAASGGYAAALHAAADTLAARSRASGAAPLNLAVQYARSGDVEQALDWLERSVAAHDPNVPYVSVAPHWDPLRSQPRFRAILRQLRLPE